MTNDLKECITPSSMLAGDCTMSFCARRKDRQDCNVDKQGPSSKAIVNPLWKVIGSGAATCESSFIASRRSKVKIVMDVDTVGFPMVMELTVPSANGRFVTGL